MPKEDGRIILKNLSGKYIMQNIQYLTEYVSEVN